MTAKKENRPKIGDRIRVIIDRPVGSHHLEYPDLIYPINYGYVEGIFAEDGEEQDVYVLGETEKIEYFEGIIIAVIHRFDDSEEKWVAAKEGTHYTKEEIEERTRFQERFFHSEIRM